MLGVFAVEVSCLIGTCISTLYVFDYVRLDIKMFMCCFLILWRFFENVISFG